MTIIATTSARSRPKTRHVFAAVFTATLLGACATMVEPQVEAVPGLINSGGALLGEASPSPASIKAILDSAQQHPLGSRDNPVRADNPGGQREYLNRLRCENGTAAHYQRRGNVGPGIYGSIVDAYEVTCEGSQPAHSMIFMDMYFPQYRETQAVPGFTIVD